MKNEFTVKIVTPTDCDTPFDLIVIEALERMPNVDVTIWDYKVDKVRAADQITQPEALNIRMAAAILYARHRQHREGWESGPSAEMCADRFDDEVANLLGALGVDDDPESIGRWLESHDAEIRAAKPWSGGALEGS